MLRNCSMAFSLNHNTATRFDLGRTTQVSTHFLSKQARKTVAARHVSGNSHGQAGFAARLFPEAPKTKKSKNRDSLTKQVPFSIRFAVIMNCRSACYISVVEFWQG